jgi:hypothetical protein
MFSQLPMFISNVLSAFSNGDQKAVFIIRDRFGNGRPGSNFYYFSSTKHSEFCNAIN